MTASPGEIQTLHLLMSATTVINVILKDPLANNRSHVWKYVRFKIVNINETKTTNKDKTVCKMCMNENHQLQDMPYQQHVNPSLTKTLDYP